MMQFNVCTPSFVVVLVDIRTKGKLKWLKEDGFKDMIGHAIARRIHDGRMQVRELELVEP